MYGAGIPPCLTRQSWRFLISAPWVKLTCCAMLRWKVTFVVRLPEEGHPFRHLHPLGGRNIRAGNIGEDNSN